MSTRPQIASRLALLTLPFLGSACEVTLPGEPVGTFTITLKLEENTCGEQAVIVTDGQQFAAELRKDEGEEGRAYWRVPDQKTLDGTLDEDLYRFVTSSIVASNEGTNAPLCSLLQTAVLEAAVKAERVSDAGTDDEADAGADAGTPATELRLEGDYTLTIEQAAGTDCTLELMPMGVFKALPCTVRYEVTGTPRDSFE